ncbi:MAG: universal stress protein, partial [Phycisphaerales bacterium]
GARPSGPPRLLVGTDGSECSAWAVEWVGRRAWPEGTEVIVVTSDECTAAFDPVVGVIPTVADEKWAMETAGAAAEKLRRPGLKVTERTAVGMAHHVLLDIAEQERVDCVFVGAHGVGAVERWLLGSVSSTLAVHAPCSVEIVHPKKAG